MKMKKITVKEFDDFKKGFTELQHRLGLTQYEVYFKQEHLSKDQAQIVIVEMEKSATVFLTDEIKQDDHKFLKPLECGKHECIHLLLHRMKWLGEQRYIETNDLDEEWEALVRRLEKVL